MCGCEMVGGSVVCVGGVCVVGVSSGEVESLCVLGRWKG